MSNTAPCVGASASARVAKRSGEGEISSSDRDALLEFQEFYEREFVKLARFARGMVSDEQAVEDIVAEAMMVVFKRWDELSVGGSGRLRAFTYGVVKNLVFDLYRSRKRYCLVGESENLEPPAEEPSDARIEMLDVERTMAQLPDKQSQVLRMELEGFTTAEIAQAMHVRESTARTHLASARRHMREKLYEALIDCPA